jgi:hypothetical protein
MPVPSPAPSPAAPAAGSAAGAAGSNNGGGGGGGPLRESDSWRLSDDALVRIRHSDPLRRALSSSELQSIILTIDRAPDRELALQQYLSNNAELSAFVNGLLDTIQHNTAAGHGEGAAAAAAPP